METGQGQVLELLLADGCRHARVACSSGLIPSPGQYLLASNGSDTPLPVPLFYTDSAPDGFIRRTPSFVAAAPVPDSWHPGMELALRGPLGRGFALPLSARKIGLVAFDDSPARLKGLIQPALKQESAVVLVCNSLPDSLPDAVEVQPLSALPELVDWADYLACDVSRANLTQLREQLRKRKQLSAGGVRVDDRREGQTEVQVLIRTPIPCGGVADCGICAVRLKSEWSLACKDGPVFPWGELS